MRRMPEPDDILKRVEARTARNIAATRFDAAQLPSSIEVQDLTIRSLGEYVLPFFLAAVEACWLNGILIGLASLNILDSHVALLPFWAPFLLLLGSMWLFRRALQHEGSEQGEDAETETQSILKYTSLRWMLGLLGLLMLILIWLQLYAESAFLFDPNWLFTFLSDILALNMHFYQALFIIGCAIYLCWRAMRIAQLIVTPGMVFKQLWTGLLVFLMAILLRANHANTGARADDVILLLLIPIFLHLALSAHALARVSWIRRDHPVGLEGSVVAQERAMLSVIAGVGLGLLFLTILGGTVFSPAFFNSAQPVWQGFSILYNLLVAGLSSLLVLIVTPFFWFFTWLFAHIPYTVPTINQVHPVGTNPKHLLANNAVPANFILAAKVILPLLILLILVLLVYWALRKRKSLHLALNRRGGDVHESVWSWRLFWGQVRGIWLAFWARFFPKRVGEERVQGQEELGGSPAVRTMREIYRALLRKAASRGLVRKRDETPYEFQFRLNQHDIQNEPQLGLLTDAYAMTRYGGNVPDEHELARLRQFWNELEQKWEAAPS